MIALYIIFGILALLIAVILIRAAMFKPRKGLAPSEEPIDFNFESAVSALQQLIRCKTVSYYDSSREDEAEFQKLLDLLPSLYPEVYRACSLTKLPNRALLYLWRGRAHDAPVVMMAHYDVVPTDDTQWEKPPFDAVIEEGVLWGRGALDTKVTFNAVMSAADTLISQGFIPEQDIYFAFSGGEEVNGPGAVHIVDWFSQNGIKPALVLDEGGAVVENVFPGVSGACGMVGIAEKGMLNLTLSVKTNGGHASAPKPHTPIGQLSAACCKVENHPFKLHLTPPIEAMFDTLGRHSTLVYRVIFSNLWLFRGVLDRLCKKSGGELNALLRTTVAFTQAGGSPAPNVIPPSASMVANIRLNPHDTVQSAVDYIRRVIDDKDIELSVENGMDPSPISELNCPAWDKVSQAVADTWKGCIVTPYLMMQCSDSRHYRDLSDHVYRFSAMDLTAEERRTIHGHNERIRLDCVKRSVEFYIRLMKMC